MKPEPVIKVEICSVCGLEWKRHIPLKGNAKNVTMEKCVELLRADLAAKSKQTEWNKTMTWIPKETRIYPVTKEGS